LTSQASLNRSRRSRSNDNRTQPHAEHIRTDAFDCPADATGQMPEDGLAWAVSRVPF
jgi:hypothetical protein